MIYFNLTFNRKKSPASIGGEMNCALYVLCYNQSHNIKRRLSIINLDSNNHSVFLLYYHLVLVVKYRRKVFDNNISDFARDTFVRIAKNYHIVLEQWNHDKDHVHIMFRAQPNTEFSKFINAYKSASSRLIKKSFPTVRQKLWKEMFWSRSFCLLTTGGAPIEIIRQYIENQSVKNE